MGKTEFARDKRRTLTEAEKALWERLRRRALCGVKFRRQRWVSGYLVDFVSVAHRIVVEVDGPGHAGRRAYDLQRDSKLRANDYLVLRFTNEEVLDRMDECLRRLEAVAEAAVARVERKIAASRGCGGERRSPPQ